MYLALLPPLSGAYCCCNTAVVGNCCFMHWLYPCAVYPCTGAYEDAVYKRDQNLIKRSLRDNDTQPVKQMKAPAKASPFNLRYCCMLLALLLRVRHGKQTRPVRSRLQCRPISFFWQWWLSTQGGILTAKTGLWGSIGMCTVTLSS